MRRLSRVVHQGVASSQDYGAITMAECLAVDLVRAGSDWPTGLPIGRSETSGATMAHKQRVER